MALNINLFVHGVPKGQKLWGHFEDDDKRYLQSFYGPNWNVPEVMKIDTISSNGVKCCFYTLVVGKNVLDSENRVGSYFALTLKMNACYVDVQNIYNLLKAVYDKMCVGTCVQVANGVTSYLIADFTVVDGQIKLMQDRIVKYLSEFSIKGDFVSANGLPVNSSSSAKSINLHECPKDVATEYMKQLGALRVSPWYPSVNAAKTIEKYKNDAQETAKRAQQEIASIQQAKQEEIDTLQKQSQEQLSGLKQQHSLELQQCKDKSAQKMTELCDKHAAEKQRLASRYANIDIELDDYKKQLRDSRNSYSQLAKEMNRANRDIANLKRQIQDIQGGPIIEPSKRSWFEKFMSDLKRISLTDIFVIIAFLLILSVLGFVGNILLKGNKEESKQETQEAKPMTTEVIKETSKESPNNPSESEGGRIDIREFTNTKQSMSANETCHISFIKDNVEVKGTWKSEDFEIIGDSVITPKTGKKGECILHFQLKGKEVASRKITVK